MVILLALAINMVASIVLGLTLASMLGPGEYGRYSIAMTLAGVAGIFAFDWLRVAAARFVGPSTHQDSISPDFRFSYMIAAALLAILGFGYFLAGGDTGIGEIAFLSALAFSIANAWFDLNLTWARAMFRNVVYARLLLVKNVLALALVLLTAAVFQKSSYVLFASALSCLLALIVNRREHASRGTIRDPAHFTAMKVFLHYGMPLILANVVFQAMALTSRAAASSALGLDQAGLLALPTDMSFRLFLVIGAALDVYFFQLVVKREQEEGKAAARLQISQNFLIILATLAPIAMIYLTMMPSLEKVFIPARFQQSFGAVSDIMVPGIFAVVMASYGFNPIFQLEKKTRPLILAAGLAFAVQGGALWMMGKSLHTIEDFAFIHSCALGLSALITIAFACWDNPSLPRLRDIAIVAAANIILAVALLPARSFDNPYLALLYAGIVAPLAYGGVILALDLNQARELLRQQSLAIRARLFLAKA